MVLMTIWLLAISVMDVRRRRVPAWLLAAGGVLAVPMLYLEGGCADGVAVLTGLFPGVLLLAAGILTKKVGYGDGIVALILGVWLENRKIVMLFGISLFFIAVWSLVLLVLRKVGRNTKIPYLPFLTAAWLLLCFDWQ